MLLLPTWAWLFIAVGVTSTWILLNIVDAFSATYTLDAGAHIVMGAVVGATGGVAAINKTREEEKKGKDK